jgi:hypothetical protein
VLIRDVQYDNAKGTLGLMDGNGRKERTVYHEQVCISIRYTYHECTANEVLQEKTSERGVEWLVGREE